LSKKPESNACSLPIYQIDLTIFNLSRQYMFEFTSTDWFSYRVTVYPHHTDYAGIVWHGSYITWMEEARVEYLRVVGLDFDRLVAIGVDLPVIDLSIRYHQSVKMGEVLVIMTKFRKPEKLRLTFIYEIRAVSAISKSDRSESLKLLENRLCVSASVSLVAVDSRTRKILRTLPILLSEAIAKLKR